MSHVKPTGKERTFAEDEVIVSKTDPKGIMTYVNDVFCKVSLYTEAEMIGKPHNVIRNPDMPGCVFKLLWDTLKSGKEIFAYVTNLCKNGDHYWVLAHATPTFDANMQITGYHSSRRVPSRKALDIIQPIYKQLLEEESKHGTRQAGVAASLKLLNDTIAKQGVTYDEFILSLEN